MITRNQIYSRISLAYLLLIPTVALLMLVLALAPLLMGKGIAPENNPFLEGAKSAVATDLAAERLEQMRYLLAISSVPAVFMLLLWLLRKNEKSLRAALSHPVTFSATLMAQVGLLVFCAYNANVGPYLTRVGYTGNPIRSLATPPYLPPFFTTGAAFVTLGAFLLLLVLAYKPAWRKRSWAWLLNTIVVVYLVMRLLPSIGGRLTTLNPFRDDAFDVYHHLVTMSEFSAIVHGHTMLVDFFPQYQYLQAYLILPVFRLIGFSYVSYTVVMSCVAFVGLMLLYQVFKAVTRNVRIAFLLFMAFLAVAFFPMSTGDSPHTNTYTYFSVGSIRYFGWMLVTYLLCKMLQRSYKFGTLILLFLAGVGAVINNVDFGIPALAGSVLAILFTADSSVLPSWRSILKVGGACVTALLVGGAVFVGFTYARSGELPDIASVLAYQRIFAQYGLMMKPIPAWGLQWIIYVTFMAAIIVAVYKKTYRGDTPLAPDERLRIGLLVHSGVSGCGIGMYYVGNSHSVMMVLIFTAWAFAAMLLVFEQFSDWRDHWRQFTRQDQLIRFIPTAILLFSLVSFWGALSITPSPSAQLARIRSSQAFTYQQLIEQSAAFIKANTSEREKVMILHNCGHDVAHAAQVYNVCPYAGPYSLAIIDQIDKVMRQLKKEHVRKIFLCREHLGNPKELVEQLSKTYTLSRQSNSEWLYFVREDK